MSTGIKLNTKESKYLERILTEPLKSIGCVYLGVVDLDPSYINLEIEDQGKKVKPTKMIFIYLLTSMYSHIANLTKIEKQKLQTIINDLIVNKYEKPSPTFPRNLPNGFVICSYLKPSQEKIMLGYNNALHPEDHVDSWCQDFLKAVADPNMQKQIPSILTDRVKQPVNKLDRLERRLIKKQIQHILELEKDIDNITKLADELIKLDELAKIFQGVVDTKKMGDFTFKSNTDSDLDKYLDQYLNSLEDFWIQEKYHLNSDTNKFRVIH